MIINNRNKLIVLMISGLFLTGCLNNNTSKMIDDLGNNIKSEQGANDTEPKGNVKIQRWGPGYNFTVNFDTTKEGIDFGLNLPKEKELEDQNKRLQASFLKILKAQVHINNEEYAIAERAIESAIKTSPENAIAYYLMGIIKNKQNKKDEAIRYFEMTLEMNPEIEGVKVYLTRLRQESK
jgi:tetratricopeptide (TPR) repeat protein